MTFSQDLAEKTSALRQKQISGTVTFIIKNAGLNVDGTFGGLKGSVDFNPLNPSKARIDVSIDPATIDTGIGLRDKHLKKVDYFDVEQFPIITIKSTSIRTRGNSKYEGTFILTIKGNAQELKIPFNVTEEGAKLRFKGSFEIDRRDFEVGGNSFLMSDDVKIEVVLIIDNS